MKKSIFRLVAAAISAGLMLIFLEGCGTTSEIEKEETVTIIPPEPEKDDVKPVVEEAKKETEKKKSKIKLDENGLPIGNYVLMEDFEDGNYWMPVGSSWNDGDMSVDDETTEEWGSKGPTSLKCIYKTNNAEFEKSGFYCDAPLETDWTDAKFVVIDVNNPNDYDITLTVALQTGEDWIWNQAEPQICEPGIHSLVFDISNFKDKFYIARMIVYLFGTPEDNGFFFFDNYRVMF